MTATTITEPCPLPGCAWTYTSGAPLADVDVAVATHMSLRHEPIEILHALKLAQAGVKMAVVRPDDDDLDFHWLD